MMNLPPAPLPKVKMQRAEPIWCDTFEQANTSTATLSPHHYLDMAFTT